jgi:hypothetical protein
VSVFRPAAKVTSPDGRVWEIYAYKIKVRDRGYPDPLGVDPPATCTSIAADWGLLDLILWLLLLIPRLLMRVGDVTWAAARSIGSDEWTVDAITFLPHETVYTWTTTSEYKGQVLAQVEGHLARGDIPLHLTNAVYRGEDRRSAR